MQFPYKWKFWVIFGERGEGEWKRDWKRRRGNRKKRNKRNKKEKGGRKWERREFGEGLW